MPEDHRQAVETADQARDGAAKLLAELISVASVDKVYGTPVVAGDRTVITAAEIRSGMGFGYGLGAGAAARARRRRGSDADAGAASSGEDGDGGPRAGGGGGGQAAGRPVAVITIGPDGVTVQPVLDRTRLALTALVGAGAIGLMLLRKRRGRR